MTTALFGSSARSSGKNLLEFKAGKMYMRGKMVHPDKRKGQVYLYQADDMLMHFCWKDRTSGAVEEDLIIFPDDCEYKRISQCTTGRVFLLRFKSTNRRLFFWMQEPKNEKDEEHCRKVNELLNSPPGSRSSTSSSNTAGLGSDLPNLRESDIQNFIGNMSHQQLMQILGNGVPNLTNLLSQSSGGSSRNSSSSNSASTTTTTATTGSTASITSTTTSQPATTNTSSTTTTATTPNTATSNTAQSPIQLSDLQNILSGAMAGASKPPAARVDLGSALNSEALQPLLTDEKFVEQLKPFLPQTEEPLPPADQLRGTISSPQFQQAVSMFSHALQSGELGPLINQFGLGDDAVAAAASCDLEAFIKALEKNKNNDKKKSEKEKKDDKEKDDDDSMAVD